MLLVEEVEDSRVAMKLTSLSKVVGEKSIGQEPARNSAAVRSKQAVGRRTDNNIGLLRM